MIPLTWSWRLAFMVLVGFMLASGIVWPVLLSTNAPHHDRLTTDWTQLFEHCRTSIELNVPLVSTAMGQKTGSGNPILGAPEANVTTLSFDNGWFEARLEARGDGEEVRSTCSIYLRDKSDVLNTEELATVFFAFIRRRQELLVEGSHEFRDTGLQPPVTAAAFSLSKPNSRGCSTVAHISVDAVAHGLSSFIGELTTPCS